MTAKEEVLETIRLWISAERREAEAGMEDEPDAMIGICVALDDLTDLLDSL